MFYRSLIRPLLFSLTHNDPEYAHELTLKILQGLSGSPLLKLANGLITHHNAKKLKRQVCDITFPNPVGLAGGFDKNGVAIPALASLGFGFIEVGTVTLRPQLGQVRPRVFRLTASHAIINRMGFNNLGVAALAKQLKSIWPPPVPIGVSLGKNKYTSEKHAAVDYCQALSIIYPYLDYLAINISSPNTPGLRDLQNRSALTTLLSQVHNTLKELANGTKIKPIFLKIAPDLTYSQVTELLAVCKMYNVSGIIATNTTLSRENLAASDRSLATQIGGLSGQPLTKLALDMVKFIHRETNGTLPIIGVGGIITVDDGLRMLDAGASLIQLYTGLVYSGISLVHDINRALLQR
ncbi:dihydroorotate dehydrogenase [Achromatium sp. WMS1]|nr:dihydroorotate dehydrogenase [Achromatium sp. WMS1]